MKYTPYSIRILTSSENKLEKQEDKDTRNTFMIYKPSNTNNHLLIDIINLCAILNINASRIVSKIEKALKTKDLKVRRRYGSGSYAYLEDLWNLNILNDPMKGSGISAISYQRWKQLKTELYLVAVQTTPLSEVRVLSLSRIMHKVSYPDRFKKPPISGLKRKFKEKEEDRITKARIASPDDKVDTAPLVQQASPNVQPAADRVAVRAPEPDEYSILLQHPDVMAEAKSVAAEVLVLMGIFSRPLDKFRANGVGGAFNPDLVPHELESSPSIGYIPFRPRSPR